MLNNNNVQHINGQASRLRFEYVSHTNPMPNSFQSRIDVSDIRAARTRWQRVRVCCERPPSGPRSNIRPLFPCPLSRSWWAATGVGSAEGPWRISTFPISRLRGRLCLRKRTRTVRDQPRSRIGDMIPSWYRYPKSALSFPGRWPSSAWESAVLSSKSGWSRILVGMARRA